jgi:NDP-sugar pyrophosphorylase family protein
MINIVVPMAGRGQRFLDKGILTPKPLLEVNSEPFISHVIDSVSFKEANFYFLIREQHLKENNFEKIFKEKKINYKIVPIKKETEGAACTVLLGLSMMNNNLPLIVKDCDQIMNWSKKNFLEFVNRKIIDGILVTVPTKNPGFSYVELLDDMSTVSRTKEKEIVSSFGNTGCYYFNKTLEYEHYANLMIKKNIRVKNEFYISQVYNEYILDNKKIVHYPIPEIFSINTPSELENNKNDILNFLKNDHR